MNTLVTVAGWFVLLHSYVTTLGTGHAFRLVVQPFFVWCSPKHLSDGLLHQHLLSRVSGSFLYRYNAVQMFKATPHFLTYDIQRASLCSF